MDEGERALVMALVEHPGAKAETIEQAYGRRDASLVLGHLVYNRFGFFRRFLDQYEDQSSILVEKGKCEGRVTWRLREATARTFRALGYIP